MLGLWGVGVAMAGMGGKYILDVGQRIDGPHGTGTIISVKVDVFFGREIMVKFDEGITRVFRGENILQLTVQPQ